MQHDLSLKRGSSTYEATEGWNVSHTPLGDYNYEIFPLARQSTLNLASTTKKPVQPLPKTENKREIISKIQAAPLIKTEKRREIIPKIPVTFTPRKDETKIYRLAKDSSRGRQPFPTVKKEVKIAWQQPIVIKGPLMIERSFFQGDLVQPSLLTGM